MRKAPKTCMMKSSSNFAEHNTDSINENIIFDIQEFNANQEQTKSWSGTPNISGVQDKEIPPNQPKQCL